MKLYRIQCRYQNLYFDKTLSAADDKAALESFAKCVDSGEIKGAEEGFYDPGRIFITFEEVDRNVSTRTSGEEASVGIAVGNTSVTTG
jgi:hypothetical protein|tara:strand:+ start:287 stop:550 length:264 start_codon:yes stop_codon:yes gene_type:complete